MAKKYVAVRVPKEVYKKILVKKVKLQNVATQLMGRPIRIPITKTLKIMADTPFFIPDEQLKKFVKKPPKWN